MIKSYLNIAHKYFQEKIGGPGAKPRGKISSFWSQKLNFYTPKTFIVFKAITLYVSQIYIVQEKAARMDSNLIYVF